MKEKQKYHPLKQLPDQSNFDAVVEWMKDETGEKKITDQQEKMYQRWSMAASLLQKYEDVPTTERILKKKYDYDISTARRDVIMARLAFGELYKFNDKEFWRQLLINTALTSIRLATEKGDLKQRDIASINLYKFSGLDKETTKDFDPSKFEQHNYYMVFVLPGMEDPIASINLNHITQLDEDSSKLLLEDIQIRMIPETSQKLLGS